ncbi:MAG: DedA family protein, partial [Lachnospiraceae bacterium]|nr:DedA family protein [Lachnospiraceae bacterium]
MFSLIILLMDQFGYWGILLLITIENLFPPIPSEVILTFGGFLTTCTQMTVPGVIAFSTIGSMIGAVILYLVGRLLNRERLIAFASGKGGRILHLKPVDIVAADDWFT